MPWIWDVKVLYKQITRNNLGLRLFIDGEQGPGRKQFAQGHGLNQRHSWKHYSWMPAPGARAHHHQPASLPHTHRNKTQKLEDSNGAEKSPALQSPGCPHWQFAVQIGSWACGSAISADCHCWNQENRLLMKVCSVLCILGPAQLPISSPWCICQILAKHQPPRKVWYSARLEGLGSALGCKIQKRRGERAWQGGIEGARRERQVGLVSNLCRP